MQPKIKASYIAGAIQSKTFKILIKHLEEDLNAYNLTPNEWKILELINENSSITLSEVSTALEVELPYITDSANKLVEKGYLEKVKSNVDKRSKNLNLTDLALETLPKIENDIRQSMRQLLFGINEEELLIYLKILETLIANDAKISKSVF